MEFFAISGSLRHASTNSTLLRALAQLAPPSLTVNIYDALETLPPFNPDYDTERPPQPVTDLRTRLRAADAVVICSPEYAHGVPGVLKNALDWIVSSGEFMHKPVGLINASPQSVHAQASLTETLTVMMANVVSAASPTLPLQGRRLDETGILTDRELTDALKRVLDALLKATEEPVI